MKQKANYPKNKKNNKNNKKIDLFLAFRRKAKMLFFKPQNFPLLLGSYSLLKDEGNNQKSKNMWSFYPIKMTQEHKTHTLSPQPVACWKSHGWSCLSLKLTTRHFSASAS